MPGILIKLRVVQQRLGKYQALVSVMRLPAFPEAPFFWYLALGSIKEPVQVFQFRLIETIAEYDEAIFLEE